MEIQAAIQAVIDHRDLTADEMYTVMKCIMTGGATPAQIGGFLIGLRMKGETVEEIASAAAVMRELATPVCVDAPYLVDTCGTGGDSAVTFNISTCCAFVAAAAGAHVAKHGNRSVSSSSGSADVLEAAGARLDLAPERIAQCVKEVGVGFMFAPAHHGAMKHAIGPRKELATRTIFNLLGPLTNPAGAPNQVIGVFSVEWVVPLANVLKNLGARHVMVAHAEDGMDELSISSPSRVAELKNGEITSYMVSPQNYGIQAGEAQDLKARDAQQSLQLMHSVFDNQPGPAREIVAFNAGAAIYTSGVRDSLAKGVEAAKAAIENGEAKRRFEAFIDFSKA